MPPARKPPFARASSPRAAFASALLLCAALAALLLRGVSPARSSLAASGCAPLDGLHVLYCGEDLMAVTAEAVPAPPGRAYGEVRVMNARGAAADSERAHFILQSWVDVAQRSSALPYIESGANLFLRLLYGQQSGSPAPKRVLLLGLGAGALPTTLKRLCGQRPALRGCAGLSVTAVDASADALAITRAFVLRDDGHTLRFVHDTAEHYLAAAARRGAWPAFLARRLLPGGGGRYDLVINDAFAGARGVARDVAALADAAAALRPVTGEYCVNALSTGADEGARARTEDAMRTVFGADAVRVEAEDASNAWLCAIAPPALTQRA